MRRLTLLLILIVAAFAAMQADAFAVTCDFTGSAGADWSVPGNWGCGGVPTSADTAVVGTGDVVAVSSAQAPGNVTLSGGEIDFSGAGALTVAAGAVLMTDGTISGAGAFSITSAATFTKTTTGSVTIQNGAQLLLGTNGSVTGGSFCLMDGVGTDPLLRIARTLTVGSAAPQALFPCTTGLSGPAIQLVPAGKLLRQGSTTTDIATPLLVAGGELAVGAGQTFNLLGNGLSQTSGSTTIASSGTLTSTGLAAVSGGTLLANGTISMPVTLTSPGILDGVGQVTGALTNTSGKVRPGGVSVAGTLTVNGAFSQGLGGALEIDRKGPAPGSGYDVLAVNGSADVAGSLTITQSGAPPAVTDGVQFLTSTAPATGMFFPRTLPPAVGPEAPFLDFPMAAPFGIRLLYQTPVFAVNDSADPPAITFGSALGVGVTLVCKTGTWSGSPAFGFAWLRDGAPIAGQTAGTHTLTLEDALHGIACRVSATTTAGTSFATTPPVPAPGVEPFNTVKPTATISGRVGDTATCTTGTWTAVPEPAFSFQWLREGVAITGETSNTYVVAGSDVSKEISCLVTATNAAGERSVESGRVVIAAIAPVNTRPPALTGKTTIGSTLTCDPGVFAGTPAPALSIEWLRGTAVIDGASVGTYDLTNADGAKAISCRVTASNIAGTVQAVSTALTANKNPEQLLAARGTAKIADAFGLPKATGCVRRRPLTITVKNPAGISLRRVKTTVNGHANKTAKVHGRYTTTINVRAIHKRKTFKLTIRITTSLGRTLVAKRTYKIC